MPSFLSDQCRKLCCTRKLHGGGQPSGLNDGFVVKLLIVD